MVSMWQTFRGCGWSSYIVLLCALLSTAVGVVAVVLSIAKISIAKLFAFGAMVVAMSPLVFGVVGMMYGRSLVDAVVNSPSFAPDVAERIRAQGYAEARGCVSVGVGGSLFPVLLSGIAVAVALVAPKKQDAAT